MNATPNIGKSPVFFPLQSFLVVARNDQILLMFIGCMSGRSDPYRLTELKNTVKVYEDELQNFLNSMEDLPRDRSSTDLVEYIRANTRALELLRKMTSAYRDYVKELEQYVPR